MRKIKNLISRSQNIKIIVFTKITIVFLILLVVNSFILVILQFTDSKDIFASVLNFSQTISPASVPSPSQSTTGPIQNNSENSGGSGAIIPVDAPKPFENYSNIDSSSSSFQSTAQKQNKTPISVEDKIRLEKEISSITSLSTSPLLPLNNPLLGELVVKEDSGEFLNNLPKFFSSLEQISQQESLPIVSNISHHEQENFPFNFSDIKQEQILLFFLWLQVLLIMGLLSSSLALGSLKRFANVPIS